MAKKKQSYKLNAEFAAEILSRKKIRPDTPGTQPGDPGNGHVLVVDSEHQKFNGNIYTRRVRKPKRVGRYYRSVNGTTYHLHIEVWKFHNGEPPKGYVVHHDCLFPNGRYNPEENNIEYLFLMTPGEHSFYHSMHVPAVEKICQNPNCHRHFLTTDGRMMYCCADCRTVANEAELHRMIDFVTPEIAKTLEEAMEVANDFFIDAGVDENGVPMEIRFCYYCHHPFKTEADNLDIMCDRPDCKGQELIKSLTSYHDYIANQIMERQNPIYGFFSKNFGNLDSIIIDNQTWYFGKKIASMLGYKKTNKAIAVHVSSTNKRLLTYAEMQDYGIADCVSRRRGLTMLNECGVNELLINSEMPIAKKIRHQITHDEGLARRSKGYYSFAENTSSENEYFTEEELMMLYLFREQMGSVRSLAAFNTLTEKQQQVVLQMIDVLHEQNQKHEAPPTIDVEAQADYQKD